MLSIRIHRFFFETIHSPGGAIAHHTPSVQPGPGYYFSSRNRENESWNRNRKSEIEIAEIAEIEIAKPNSRNRNRIREIETKSRTAKSRNPNLGITKLRNQNSQKSRNLIVNRRDVELPEIPKLLTQSITCDEHPSRYKHHYALLLTADASLRRHNL